MPPRIPLTQAAGVCRASVARPGASSSSVASLFAALSIQQTRSASILETLRPNPGSQVNKTRVGRGPSSGKGKTAGRGMNGQKQHGKIKPWFQGGQTSLLGVWGTRGFINRRAPVMCELPLDRLQAWIDAGRIDPTKPIGPRELHQAGLLRGLGHDGIKLLATRKEALRTPINIVVSRASAQAIEAIEGLGGSVVTRHFTRMALRRICRGESELTTEPLAVGAEHVEAAVEKARSQPLRYRLPEPVSRWAIEYYRDPAHRGYLSHQIQPGESPSLFHIVPKEKMVVQPRVKAGKIVRHDIQLFKIASGNRK